MFVHSILAERDYVINDNADVGSHIIIDNFHFACRKREELRGICDGVAITYQITIYERSFFFFNECAHFIWNDLKFNKAFVKICISNIFYVFLAWFLIF